MAGLYGAKFQSAGVTVHRYHRSENGITALCGQPLPAGSRLTTEVSSPYNICSPCEIEHTGFPEIEDPDERP